jgi:hypothetical protein
MFKDPEDTGQTTRAWNVYGDQTEKKARKSLREKSNTKRR